MTAFLRHAHSAPREPAAPRSSSAPRSVGPLRPSVPRSVGPLGRSVPRSVGPFGPSLQLLDRPARRSSRDRRLLTVVGGGLLFAAVLAGNVAVQAQTAQGQFDLERLQETARQRQASYQQLRLRVAELEAPQNIGERARQLGMVEPDVVTYLTPTASTSSDLGAPPQPVATTDEAAQSWSHVKRHLESR